MDWLSRDPAEVDAYVADPLCGDDVPPTYGYGAGMFELVVHVATADAVATLPDGLPVLLLAGRRDPVGGEDAAQVSALAELLRRRGLPVEDHLYADARHEVFNETNRDEVTADLVAWLEGRLRTARCSWRRGTPVIRRPRPRRAHWPARCCGSTVSANRRRTTPTRARRYSPRGCTRRAGCAAIRPPRPPGSPTAPTPVPSSTG